MNAIAVAATGAREKIVPVAWVIIVLLEPYYAIQYIENQLRFSGPLTCCDYVKLGSYRMKKRGCTGFWHLLRH